MPPYKWHVTVPLSTDLKYIYKFEELDFVYCWKLVYNVHLRTSSLCWLSIYLYIWYHNRIYNIDIDRHSANSYHETSILRVSGVHTVHTAESLLYNTPYTLKSLLYITSYTFKSFLFTTPYMYIYVCSLYIHTICCLVRFYGRLFSET